MKRFGELDSVPPNTFEGESIKSDRPVASAPVIGAHMWPFKRRRGIEQKTADKPTEYLNSLDALLQRRHVMLSGKITDETLEDIVGRLVFLDSVDAVKPILLCIQSPGGSVSASLVIADIMRSFSAPIHTYVPAYAHGTAILVLAAGCKGERVVGPSAMLSVLPLEPSSDRIIPPAEFIRTRNKIAGFTAEVSGQSVRAVTRDLMFGRNLSAAEAVEYGLADRVGRIPDW